MLFAIAELMYHKLGVRAEYTRKFVHILTGFLTLLFPIFFNHHAWVLLLCTGFAVILVVSLKMRLIPSINAIDRESVGSIAYPVAVYACFLFFEYHDRDLLFFYVPILMLAICDPMAALFGKRWPLGRYRIGPGYKTAMGTGMFVISAVGVNVVLLTRLSAPSFTHLWALVGLIAIACAFAEALSPKGWDNVTIPAAALVVLELWSA